MLGTFFEEHWTDSEGRPAGGVSSGTGFTVSWQNGPLNRGEDRKEPNGAFVETVLKAVVGRLEFYQASQFNCQENADAIDYINTAIRRLNSRTQRRETAGTEGTHKGN